MIIRLGYVKAVWAIAHRNCKNPLKRPPKRGALYGIGEARNPPAIQRAINHHLKALRRLGYSIPTVAEVPVA